MTERADSGAGSGSGSDVSSGSDAGSAAGRAFSFPQFRIWAQWASLAVVVILALVVGSMRDSGTSNDAERVTAISRTIKCPTCQGESVADSDAGPSREIRRDIAERVQRGETDDQIRSYYADRYGDEILLTPPRSGVGSLVWVIPVVVVLGAAAALAVVFRGLRKQKRLEATDEDRALVEQALRERKEDSQ